MDSILIKTLAAVILGFVISAVLGKYLVPALRRWKAGQAIKEDGPTWHMSKQGTPTMGGLMFIAAVAIVVLVLNALGGVHDLCRPGHHWHGERGEHH